MATKRMSLADQIAELEEPTPIDFDPEGINHADSDNEQGALNRDHYVDVGPSSINPMLDIAISNPKYHGVKISRKSLEHGDDDSDSHEDFTPDPHFGVHEGPERSDESEDTDGEEDDDQEGQSPNHDESELATPDGNEGPQRPHRKPAEPEDDLTNSLHQKREEDLRKGKSVAKQISVWNKVMETRIRIQKINSDACRLPHPSILTKLSEEPDCQESLKRLLDETLSLSSDIFELRETLVPESISAPPRKKRKLERTTDDISYYEEELRYHSATHAVLEQAYHPHLVQTLSKWSSKIQAVTPSALLPSNRNTFSKSQPNPRMNSVVNQIDDTLMSDHTKLISRTRLSKGGKLIKRLGETEKDEKDLDEATSTLPEDRELFDDTDFYQQLLRDVIDSNEDQVDQSWKVLQKQKKAKKKVDTKASKGRKIRYEVHEKIQNFMVPIPPRGGWHEEQIDELFISLLGKGVEDRPKDDNLASVAMDGFRLFG